jgi:L-fuculose-phosphate aldolase
VTSEFLTHLAAYEERPDIQAVCHAHPPKAVAFTLAGLSLARCVLPEVVMSIGGIPAAPYATPGTPEGNNAVRGLIQQCDALLLDRHGALTVGVDLFDAYYKLEKVEHAAETVFAAHQLGELRTLDASEVERLSGARSAYGAKGRAYRCGEGN